jgi:chromate transport protein ChrA
MMEEEVVRRRRWITQEKFLDLLLGGLPGALFATVGIFLPSFVFVAVNGPLVPRLRRWPVAGAFLDGLNVATLALMAVVTWHLGRAAIFDLTTAVLLMVSAILLVRFRVNSTSLVLGGAAIGLLIRWGTYFLTASTVRLLGRDGILASLATVYFSVVLVPPACP